MVQRKAPNDLVPKASPSLKTEKNPSFTIKPSTQNHDTNSKEPELAENMIKSQSLKRSSDQPQKLPPNYMKATSCSQAREEKKQPQVPKLPSNRSPSLKKVRIFTKAPNFKSTRSINSVSKSPTATCSSTLKDGKFPPFLDLNPGGTELQGASVVKVCHYSHCSLNGHKHSPPLKSFLSTRRKALREQRIMKSAAPSPCKNMSCANDGEMKEEVGVDLVADKETSEGVNNIFVGEEQDDFFLVIYVKEDGEDKAKGILEEKETSLIDRDFNNSCSKEEGDGGDGEFIHECDYDGGIFDWESATSDQESDVEFKDRLYLAGVDIGDGISSPSDQERDSTFVNPSGDEILGLLDEEGVERDDVGIAFRKEFLQEERDEFSRDEITDCYVQFSDSESSANDVNEEKEFRQFLQDYGFSDDENTVHEEQSPTLGENLEETKVSGQEHENTALIGIENPGFTMQASSLVSQETSNLNTNHDEPNTCESLKTRIRSRKQWESSEGLKLFNPREPNYLEVEPGAEGEKVELRHNETDERRNAEEWMLDYALRKAVNQLALDRKRKVTLLVEAFEKVVPPGTDVNKVKLGMNS